MGAVLPSQGCSQHHGTLSEHHRCCVIFHLKWSSLSNHHPPRIMTSLLKFLLLFFLQKLVYLLAEENLPTVIAVRQQSFAPAGQKLSFRQKLWIFVFSMSGISTSSSMSWSDQSFSPAALGEDWVSVHNKFRFILPLKLLPNLEPPLCNLEASVVICRWERKCWKWGLENLGRLWYLQSLETDKNFQLVKQVFVVSSGVLPRWTGGKSLIGSCNVFCIVKPALSDIMELPKKVLFYPGATWLYGKRNCVVCNCICMHTCICIFT